LELLETPELPVVPELPDVPELPEVPALAELSVEVPLFVLSPQAVRENTRSISRNKAEIRIFFIILFSFHLLSY
jgi:hypothetical protein